MRVVLTNFGTVGDFRPLISLAHELTAAGHKAVLAFPPAMEALIPENGLEYLPVGPDLRALRDEVNRTWSEETGIDQSSEQMLRLLMPFQEYFDRIFEELREVCAKADVIISGPAQPLARMIYEKTGIPFVSVQFSHFGGHGGPALREAGDRLVNPFRKKLGLPQLKDPLTIGANSPQLALYAMSAHLRPRSPDWPHHYHITGFFFDNHAPSWSLDPELEKFVLAGNPPVVITLGSMVHREPSALARLLAEAVEMAGCRAVIQGIAKDHLPDGAASQVYWAGFAPHEWLFSKASCVVLHGGAGTAASVFRAGVPGVFIPHGDCYDQRYWAELALAAGCAVPAVPYLELTSRRLASAIEETLKTQSLHQSAKVLSAKIRKEAGTRLAVHLVTELVARTGLWDD